MKANRITQIVLAAGIALTASVPAFSAPASSLQETSTATTAPGEQAPGKEAQGDKKGGERGHHRGHHGHHGEGARGDKGHGMMLRGIELTEEQKTKVGELHKAAAPEMRAAMKEAFEARRALHELTVSGSFDEAKAREIAQKGADAMARASVLKAKTHSQVLSVLTPEQRKELADRAEKRKERMQQRMQERMKKQQEAKAGTPAGQTGGTSQPGTAQPGAARPSVTQ
jgi:periplasmic protein CpxP/Spy